VHLIVLAAGVAVLGAAVAFAAAVDVDGSFLTREPQAALDGPSYAGVISNLGALVWAAGAMMALVGWLSSPGAEARRMFRAGTIVGVALLVDDFFLIHDIVGARIETADRLMPAIYLAAVVALLLRFREALGPLAAGGILASLVLLGMSAGADVLLNETDQIVEDGLKFLGSCTWATAWTLRACPWDLRPRVKPPPAVDEATRDRARSPVGTG
jgi:hypothetical protein